ncbi:deoxyribose-phosphate aldolase [Photobacterium rosenbergii]|uniref:Deoxyribose-phosphate aldolase n=1 Tax=Photobacterium rosenbergii TaxID=294936 RepID=A0A2T3N9R9_9GAMM|nr:deoxyribose-phosphate aldolase [Photobacterium rosenbergii]PSW10282.1 deoxyribose-phosphate aldolase [Photobacterium rosenbergii]
MIDFNDPKQVAKAIQFTNVNPELTKDELIAHLEICKEYGFDAAMIAPCWVKVAKEYLKGTGIRVATTLNFPQANDTTAMKVALVHQLGTEGADEFDFPPNPGFLLSGMEEEYYQEIKQVTEAAHSYGMKVKVMLEFGFLPTDELKIKATQLSMKAGVDWVKQSSGWGKGGCAATEHDVRILKENIQAPCKVKVSGKVNTIEKMQAMFEAGAELVGTSSGPEIVKRMVGDINAY